MITFPTMLVLLAVVIFNVGLYRYVRESRSKKNTGRLPGTRPRLPAPKGDAAYRWVDGRVEIVDILELKAPVPHGLRIVSESIFGTDEPFNRLFDNAGQSRPRIRGVHPQLDKEFRFYGPMSIRKEAMAWLDKGKNREALIHLSRAQFVHAHEGRIRIGRTSGHPVSRQELVTLATEAQSIFEGRKRTNDLSSGRGQRKDETSAESHPEYDGTWW